MWYPVTSVEPTQFMTLRVFFSSTSQFHPFPPRESNTGFPVVDRRRFSTGTPVPSPLATAPARQQVALKERFGGGWPWVWTGFRWDSTVTAVIPVVFVLLVTP